MEGEDFQEFMEGFKEDITVHNFFYLETYGKKIIKKLERLKKTCTYWKIEARPLLSG